MSEVMYKIGPVGKSHKKWDEKGRSQIVQIFISYSGGKASYSVHGRARISSIHFHYVDTESGDLVRSKVFGSQDFCAPGFSSVELDYVSEYITGVSGYKDDYLEELTIHTNIKSYGPFGDASNLSSGSGCKFELQIGPSNQFGGFHGTHNDLGVCSLGLYLKPTTNMLLPTDIGWL